MSERSEFGAVPWFTEKRRVPVHSTGSRLAARFFWLLFFSREKKSDIPPRARKWPAATNAHPQAINPIASTASARPARFHFVVASPNANTPTSAPSTTTPMFMPANTVAGLSGIDWCACT